MFAAGSKHDAQRRLWLVLAAAFLGWMFDGIEMGLFPLVARPALHEMGGLGGAMNDQFTGLWMGRITALFLVGAAFGGVVFGWLGDRVGRVRAMSISILCYSLFTGLGYFSQAPWQLGFFRFIAALGMGGEWSLGVALVMETWPREKRPLMAGIIGAAVNVGTGLIAAITLFFPVTNSSWRWLMLVGAAPAVLTLFIRLFVPESDRWEREVREHGTPHPLGEVFRKPLLRNTLLAISLASVALVGTWGTVQWLPLWADQMAGSAHPYAKGFTGLASAFGSVLGCLVGAWMGARLGRRIAYFWISLGSLVSCAVLFRAIHAYSPTFLLLTFVVGAVTAAYYGWIPLYLPELFPTRVRATAQGIGYNSGRFLAAAGAILMGQLMQSHKVGYAGAGSTVTLVYMIGMVIIWFAPETQGKGLPE